MAVNDFVRRSLQIVGGGIVQSTTDYFDNAISFTNDVKEVIDMGKQMGSSGAKKFNELKSSGILKKTRDWFYNEGGMFGDFDFDDDDFDAGFEIESADSNNDGSSSLSPLSKEMMTDIAKKQTGAIYKAFGRQADLQIGNTAEIISTINTRTAELTASVNNINNTLIQIGKRLDLIVEWTSGRAKKEEEERIKSGILDYGGGISLTGVINKAKYNAEDSMLGSILSMGKTMLGSGLMTPETVMSMILSQTILDKKWNKLGDKSINDIGEFINDTVGEVIQNAMTKVLTSKNDILESLFEDIITRSGNKNYQNSVKNSYNDKPAVFDGMTRKSIITVIPGYLNEILKAVSKDGAGRNVDSKGNLTTATTNSFVNEVADSYFRSGTMEYGQREKAKARTSLEDKEITNAMRTLTGCWMWYMYRSNRVILEKGEVKDISYESTRSVVDQAAYLMATADPQHRSEEKWKLLYEGIIEQIDEFKYRQEIQKSAERADKNLESFAKTNVNNHQATKINSSVMLEAFRKNFSDFNSDAKFRDPNVVSAETKSTQIGSSSTILGITELDYMAGMFDRLNRGINVFITGQKDINKNPYYQINMAPGYAGRKSNGAGTSTPDAANTVSVSQMVDKMADILPSTDKKKEKMDEATKEAYEAMERGEELSRNQKKLIKEYEKQNGKYAWIKDKLHGWVENSQREGIVADPELYEGMSKATESIKNFFKDIIPDSLKGAIDKAKETQLYNDIVGSNTAKKTKEKFAKGKEKTADILLGEKRTDEEGNEFRAEGLFQKGYAKTGRAIGAVDNAFIMHTPTKILKNRVKKLNEDYGQDKTFDENDTDSQIMQAVTSMTTAAMANGDFSSFDQQKFNELRGSLKSPKLKRLLDKSIVPLLKKNATFADDTKDKSKDDSDDKSTLGKLVSIVKGTAGLILKPIISYIKLVAGGSFLIIKKGLGSLFNFTKKRIKHSLTWITAGAKSFAKGVGKLFKPMITIAKTSINITYGVMKRINGFIGSIKDRIVNGIGKIFTKNKNNNADESSDEKKKGFIDKTKEKLSGIGDRLANTSLGKGFMKATKERKAAEEKAKLKEQAAPIKEGIETSEVGEMGKDLKDALEAEDGKKGFFKKLISLVQGIYDKTPDKSESESEQTPETDTNTNTENNTNTEKTQTTENNDTETDADTGGKKKGIISKIGGAIKGGVSGMLEGIGEILGGLTGMMGGLLEAVLSVVMSLEGFKALTNLVMEILKSSLEPLNDAFQVLIKTTKPLLKQLGGVIKQISEFIVVIVDAVMDVIKPVLTDVVQPILEVISPLLQSILSAVTPILKVVGTLVKVIMAPFMGLFKFVLLPILKIIGDAVQIIMGVVQIGFGLIMAGIGALIAGIGKVISHIPGAGGKGKDLAASGSSMFDQGTSFVESGLKSVGQGIVNIVLDTASLYSLGATDELLGRNATEDQHKETKQIEAPEGNIVQQTFASGDTNNYYNDSSNVYNTYAGEYQRGMGGYLNMNQRGCGPIALADMYNRNANGRVNARSLAGSMYSNGRYDPRRGTSVGDYIDTARSMGMNLTPGKVTQQSLKHASPTNPITVVGSGSDYGTRRGNNHFMNVIGTDSHGTAFVSNPLTGRIDRKPVSTIAGSAVLGLYGSGDENGETGYTFPDAVQEAFQKLKDEAAKVLGLFSMGKSDEEEVEEIMNSERQKAAAEQAKKDLGDEYAEYEEQAKSAAFEDFKKKYPQRDNESDDEYQKKFDKWWEGTADQSKYLAEAGVFDSALEAARKKNSTVWDEINNSTNEFVKGMSDSIKSANAAANADNEQGGSGYFTSDEGVPLWVPYGDNIQITETDITKGPANSPLFEFFAKTMGLSIGDIYGSGWYTHYDNPNKEGVGSAGLEHYGIDFTGGEILGKPLYATTGGKVIANWTPGESSGGGNAVVWEDIAGKYHWYMHMKEPSTLNVGDTIEGGDLIGYVGNTGISSGEHLHYSINDTLSKSGAGHTYNPLMYFNNYNPSGGEHGVALGDTDEEKIYSYLITAGMTPIGAAGLMGCFKYESDMKTNNLENTYNNLFGLSDTEYTSAVDSGRETENQFVTGRGNPAGYGVAQFTSSNLKQDLYNRTVKQGGSISKLEPQLDAIISELKARGIYDTINNAKSPTDANKTFLWKYEAGTSYTSDDAVIRDYPWFLNSNPDGAQMRHQYAEQVYNTYKNWKPQAATHGFTDSNGNIRINSPGDERMYRNLQETGSTSGKGTGIVITKTDQLNVRKDKSINSEIIGHLNSGDKIEIEACNSKDWLYVPSLGGYVSSDFINVLTSDAQSNDWSVEDPAIPVEIVRSDTSNFVGPTNLVGPRMDAITDGTSWYDFGSWFDLNDNSAERNLKIKYYNDAAKYHLQAEKGIGKNGKKAVGSEKNIIDNYIDTYGADVITRGNSTWFGDQWEYYGDGWQNIYDSTKGKSNVDYSTYPISKQLKALGRIYGSGDAFTEDQFWNNYLKWNNSATNITPGLSDGSDTAYSNETYYDNETGTCVVNNYAISRGYDKDTHERLKAVLENTYNVRSERLEALLMAVLEELKKRKGPTGGGNNTNGSQKLFDERIPSQVTRLSIG